MKTIYKYTLDRVDWQVLGIPAGATILFVERQRSDLCLWAEVDLAYPEVARTIILRGTGHPFNGQEDVYIGTIMDGGNVWHVYEDV